MRAGSVNLREREERALIACSLYVRCICRPRNVRRPPLLDANPIFSWVSVSGENRGGETTRGHFPLKLGLVVLTRLMVRVIVLLRVSGG